MDTIHPFSNQHPAPRNIKKEWRKHTVLNKETRAITKVFKNTRIKVTYSTNTTLEKLLTKKHHPPQRQILKLPNLPVNLLYVQQEIRGTNQKILQDPLSRAPTELQAWKWEV